MPRVVHFQLPADDPERAIKFYQDVFGWQVFKWEGPIDYWLVSTGADSEPGIHGAIARRENPNESTMNTIDVPSAEEYLAKVVAAGGQVVMPVQFIPGVGWLACCADTEGNLFGVRQDVGEEG